MQIFVYGTLMAKHERNMMRRIADDEKKSARLISEGTIVAEMRDLGPYPAITQGDNNIHGELWDVEDALLQSLDAYECCPSLYKRVSIEVRLPHGETTQAQAYFLNNVVKSGNWKRFIANAPVVKSGDWMRHIASR